MSHYTDSHICGLEIDAWDVFTGGPGAVNYLTRCENRRWSFGSFNLFTTHPQTQTPAKLGKPKLPKRRDEEE